MERGRWGRGRKVLRVAGVGRRRGALRVSGGGLLGWGGAVVGRSRGGRRGRLGSFRARDTAKGPPRAGAVRRRMTRPRQGSGHGERPGPSWGREAARELDQDKARAPSGLTPGGSPAPRRAPPKGTEAGHREGLAPKRRPTPRSARLGRSWDTPPGSARAAGGAPCGGQPEQGRVHPRKTHPGQSRGIVRGPDSNKAGDSPKDSPRAGARAPRMTRTASRSTPGRVVHEVRKRMPQRCRPASFEPGSAQVSERSTTASAGNSSTRRGDGDGFGAPAGPTCSSTGRNPPSGLHVSATPAGPRTSTTHTGRLRRRQPARHRHPGGLDNTRSAAGPLGALEST